METVDDTVSKLVFDVLRGSIRPADAANTLRSMNSGADVASTVLDYVWLGGFDESNDSRSRLQQLISILMQDEFVPIADAVCALEPEFIPNEIQTEQVIRRKRTQAKTKKVYNITKFNTLSECPEGYSILLDIFWCASEFGVSSIEATVLQCKKAIGQFSLCPNRSLSLALSVVSWKSDNSCLPALIGLLFPVNRIQSVVLFHVLSLGKEGAMVGPSDPSESTTNTDIVVNGLFFRGVAGLVDLQALWPVLTPATETIKSLVSNLLAEYERQIENVSKILGGAISSESDNISADSIFEKSVSSFSDALESTQKFLLLSEMFRSPENFDVILIFLRNLQNLFGSVPIAAVKVVSNGLAAWLTTLLMDTNTELIEEILGFLGVYLGSHPLLFARVCELGNLAWTAKFLLPAQSVMSPSPFFNDKIWTLLAEYTPSDRYERVYKVWQHQYTTVFPLRLVAPLVQAEVRHLLKRVVKGAQIGDTVSRNSHYQFAKLAATHGVLVLSYVLGQIQAHFNHNLIEPFVDVTGKIGPLAQDVLGFLLCGELAQTGRPSLSAKTAMVQPWLANLSEFSGKFLKKHSQTTSPCLEGLLHLVRVLLARKADSCLSGTPARVLLGAIVENLGNVEVVDDLNAAQLESIAGGPVLSTISQQSVSVEKSSIVERGRAGLKTAILKETGLIDWVFAKLASAQMELRTSQKIAKELMVGGGVKLLGILNDSIHKTWLQLTEFLTQVCSLEEYRALVQFRGGENLAMNFHVSRPASVLDAHTLFDTFWGLRLFDIYVPEESYQKQIGSLCEQIGAQEMLAEKLEKTEPKDRSARKEVVRLKELLGKLELEFKSHQNRHGIVLKKIRDGKSKYFENSPNMNFFVDKFIAPRILVSVPDALFCVQFIKMLVREKVAGFQCVEFFNAWTETLPRLLCCSSEGETRLFAYFVAELFAWLKELRDPKKFAHTVTDNAVWAEISFEQFALLHATWEANVLKWVIEGLEIADWGDKRNCLILISKTCHVFPSIHANAVALTGATETLTSDSQEDIATLALSLSRRIKSMEANWLDKPDEPMQEEPPAKVVEPIKRPARLDAKLEPSPRLSKRAGTSVEDQSSKRFRDERSDRMRDREPPRNRDAPRRR